MHAFRPTPKKLRIAASSPGAPPSWDSQVASRMLRMFCHQHNQPPHHACRASRIPSSSRQYHSVSKPSTQDHDVPHQRLFHQEYPSVTTTLPGRARPTITSFLAPPGIEKHHNPYETIADSFKRSKPNKGAKAFIKDRQAAGSDPVSPMAMLNDAINSMNAKQIWHTYTRLISKAPEARRSLFNFPLYARMLYCLQTTKTPESAVWAHTIFEDMTKHHRPSTMILNSMLDILTRHEDLDSAIEFFERNAARYDLRANIRSYNIMIRGLGSRGQIEAARKIYDDMRSGVIPKRPDVTTYSTLMSQYAKNGMQTEADAILDHMFKDEVQPNMWIFNSVIKRFVQRKDYGGAMRTMALMKKSDLQPDVVTYSTLIDSYARDGNEEAIAQIQADMAANKVYPNARMITSTIKVFARTSLDSDIDSQLAGLLKSLPTGEMHELTFGVLMNVYRKRRDLDAAMGIYEHIVSKKRPVNDVIVNTLLDGYVRANQIPTANKIFHDHFTARGVQPTSSWTYNIMITGCCKEGRLQDALHYYHEMNKFGIAPDSIVCSRMIQLYLQHRQLDNAQQMMRLMRNAKMTIPVQTYTMLMDYHSNSRDVRGALRYYQEMLDSGVKPDVQCFTVLINAHIRAKNYAGCDLAFEHMTKMGIKPSLHILTSMVRAHSIQGNTDRVKEYWEAISYSGYLPDLKAFTALMQSYAQQSNVEMVEFIFKEIDRRRLKVDAITLLNVIGAYGSLPRLNVGRVEEIAGIMEELELEPNGEYFRVLLDIYGRHGLPDRVIKTWKQLKGLDKPLEWVPSTSNLLHLIEACRERGYMDTLHSVWHSATTIGHAASASDATVPQGPTLDEFRGYVESGLDQQIQNPLLRSNTPRHVAKVGAATAGSGGRRMICPEPEVFTAYLNALLTHNRFGEIERLLEEETREMRLMPRSEDFELLFTSLAQYGFLKKELESIRRTVVQRWPAVERMVDKIIAHTRKI